MKLQRLSSMVNSLKRMSSTIAGVIEVVGCLGVRTDSLAGLV